jgi:hypothetical protein
MPDNLAETLGHVGHLLKGGELGHLGYELAVLHGIGRILVLQLGHEYLQEVVLVQFRFRRLAAPKSLVEGVYLELSAERLRRCSLSELYP